MKAKIKRFIAPVLITLICALVALLPHSLLEQLIFERSTILNGEAWRLLTANLLHSNGYHLLLNMGGLWVIWYFYYDLCQPKWHPLLVILTMLGTTSLLLAFSPEMQRYVGLSGALHGIIVTFAMIDFRYNRAISIAVLIAVAGKLTFEQVYGGSASLESLINARVAVDSHLWGALSGAIIAPLMIKLNKDESSQ